MNQHENVPLDELRIARIFERIVKMLQHETQSPAEALAVLKFGVAFFENRLGIDVIDDHEIRDFIDEVKKEMLRFE
jgi:hypothetical protein